MARIVTITGPGVKVLEKILKSKGSELAEIYGFIQELFNKEFGPKAGGHIVKTQLSGGIVPAFGKNKERKNRRTGRMAASIIGKGITFKGLPAIEVGTFKSASIDVIKYAWVQEFGTKSENPESPIEDIRPKGAGAMVVPVGPNLTPAGVARKTILDFASGDLIAIYFGRAIGRNKNVVGKLVSRAHFEEARNSAIANNQPKPAASQLDASFLLLNRVKIKPGFFLLDGLRDYALIMTIELAQLLSTRFLGKESW